MQSPRWACRLGAALALLASAQVIAADSGACAHCHGLDGNAPTSAYPSLAGQPGEYLYRQIKAYQEGRRRNTMMAPAVSALSDDDTRSLAEFFAAQPLTPGTARTNPALVAEGRKLAEAAQCAACHRPDYEGLNEFPRLARQKYPYLVKQLKDFRDGLRTNDNGVMGATVKAFSDRQIEAIAQYLTSL